MKSRKRALHERTTGSPLKHPNDGHGAASRDPVMRGGNDAVVHHMFGRDFLYVLGGVLPLAVSALILPALTRMMGREQFGIVSLAVAISSVLYVLLSFGMQLGVQREYPKERGHERAREFVTISFVCILVLSAGLVASARSWAGVVGASQFPWAMELTAAYSGASAIALICLGVLRSADRLKAFLGVVLLQSVGGQLIGAALLIGRGHTARQYLLGLVIGQIAAGLLALIFVRPRVPRIVRAGTFLRALSFTLPLVPNQLANFLLWSGDRIVVQRDLGSTAQARYAVAYAVGAIAINITSQLNQAWMPRVFAIANVTERRRVLAQVQNLLFSLLAPGVLAISLGTPFLLILASPGSYHPYTLVLVTLLIVPTALPYSVALANTRTLLAHGKSGRLAASTFACAAINIALNILWVPHLGITGSALATLVAYACQAWLSGVLVWSASDRLPDRFKAELLEWAVVGACVATALIPHAGPGVTVRIALLALAVGVFLLRTRGVARRRRELVPRTPAVVEAEQPLPGILMEPGEVAAAEVVAEPAGANGATGDVKTNLDSPHSG